MYSSTPFLTSGLDWRGGGAQYHALAALPLAETWYSLYSRMGGPQDWPGKLQKILPPPGFDPWTNQSTASCYTDYTIPAHKQDSYIRQVIAFKSLAKCQISYMHPAVRQ
jgi:hypothetical protein